MSDETKYRLETNCIVGGRPSPLPGNPIVAPISMSSTYYAPKGFLVQMIQFMDVLIMKHGKIWNLY